MDLNNVIVVGRLTKDCEVSYTTGGTCVGKFSIACNRRKAKDGSEATDFFDVTCFGGQAEHLGKQYLVKGKQIGLRGRLQQDRWTDGNGQARSKVSIVAEDIQLLGGTKAGGNSQQNGNYQQDGNEGFPEDIPF